MLSIDTVQDCLYGTSIYTDAQKLARRLFEEVVTDVVLECEDCDDVSSIDDEGREEVKRRWVPFLEMLPEYKNICEDILAGNKDKYSELGSVSWRTITAILAAAVPDMPTINSHLTATSVVPVAAEGITTVAAMAPAAGLCCLSLLLL